MLENGYATCSYIFSVCILLNKTFLSMDIKAQETSENAVFQIKYNLVVVFQLQLVG